jgi:hypothetical protein
MTPYLVGVHTADGEWASVKVIPSRESRSRFGVGILDFELSDLTSPDPMSSAMMKIMFGFCAAWAEQRVMPIMKWSKMDLMFRLVVSDWTTYKVVFLELKI